MSLALFRWAKGVLNACVRGGVSVKRPNWNVTGGRFRSYVLWVVIHNHPQIGLNVKESRRRCFTARFLCATPVCVLLILESALSVLYTGANWWKYRRQVSILWPSAYKAITNHKTDLKVKKIANDVFRRSAAELHRYVFCWSWRVLLVSYTPVRIDDNTDNPFRSSDLRVMSPARCLCAMSVKFGLCEWDRLLPTTHSHIHIVECL